MPNSKLFRSHSELRQVFEWMLQTTIALFALYLLLPESSCTPATTELGSLLYLCQSACSLCRGNVIEIKIIFSRLISSYIFNTA